MTFIIKKYINIMQFIYVDFAGYMSLTIFCWNIIRITDVLSKPFPYGQVTSKLST